VEGEVALAGLAAGKLGLFGLSLLKRKRCGLVQPQNTYSATGWWFDKLTTNGLNPFALSHFGKLRTGLSKDRDIAKLVS
jgi:hypothetical protein